MTQEEGILLLKVARSAIEAHLSQRPFVLPEVRNPLFLEKRGIFVTLNAKGNLRGCIGRLEPTTPLIETVSQMALEAAFNDPRFLPLRGEELPSVLLELSIISTVKKIHEIKEIQVGRDGLLIQRGVASGLLLPQVATVYHWTKEEFLTHTCLKAGLSTDAWKEGGTEIFTFTAEIFSEEKDV